MRLPQQVRAAWSEVTRTPPGITSPSSRHRVTYSLRSSSRLVRHYYGRAPATLVYLFTLGVTWWTVQGVDPRLVHRLIVSASTNVDNLRHHPGQVLVASAFWVDSTAFPWALLLEFLLLAAFVERWLGTRRFILVFAAGHVGASVLVATGLIWALHHHLLPERVAHASDVGSSYGFLALAAVFTYWFDTRQNRLLWAGGMSALLLARAGLGQTFTDYGHVLSAGIGFALYPLVRAPRRRQRLRDLASGAASSSPTGPTGARRLTAWTV